MIRIDIHKDPSKWAVGITITRMHHAIVLCGAINDIAEAHFGPIK